MGSNLGRRGIMIVDWGESKSEMMSLRPLNNALMRLTLRIFEQSVHFTLMLLVRTEQRGGLIDRYWLLVIRLHSYFAPMLLLEKMMVRVMNASLVSFDAYKWL
mmetsp:Transcript_10730/g.13686  ORF Transcript_10730/g.13686 Transcript_10730/m.13686 type:complete len:103 (-) Transcript_10730:266-574(-)